MGEWFLELGYEGQLATWLVASFLLYTLASQLAWQLHWVFPGGAFPRQNGRDKQDDGSKVFFGRLRHQVLTPWLGEATRFVYYLGIPFVAVVSGWLGADLMGISGTEWVEGQSIQGFLWEDWARGLGLASAAVAGLLTAWFVGRVVSRWARLAPAMLGLSGPLWQRLLDACYLQIHWAFYRSGPILWLDDIYWGTFAGLALVVLETGLNPAHRWALKSPQTAAPPLTQLGLAWISALVFLATQNLWLTTGVHFLIVLLVGETKPDSLFSVYGTADRMSETTE
jgi:hypothetical protein